MKTMLKEALILFIITLMAGACLGGVYVLTKEPIKQQKALAEARAFQEVFSDATSFVYEDGFDADAETAALYAFDADHDNSGSEINKFALAYNGDELLGAVIVVTNAEGFGGDITFSLGIRMDGSLNGISITDISETAGLGMKAPDVLAPQFAQKGTDARFVVTKSGAVYPNDIDAISSATITSKAVTNGVNAGVGYFYMRLSQEEEGIRPFANASSEGGSNE